MAYPPYGGGPGYPPAAVSKQNKFMKQNIAIHGGGRGGGAITYFFIYLSPAFRTTNQNITFNLRQIYYDTIIIFSPSAVVFNTVTFQTFKHIIFFLCCLFFSLVTLLVQDTLLLVILLIMGTLPPEGILLLHQDTPLLLVAILLLLADIHLPQGEAIHQHQVQSYLFI